MPNSLIQTEMSELVIGLSSEHTYREITPAHTHSRATVSVCFDRDDSSVHPKPRLDRAADVRTMDSDPC